MTPQGSGANLERRLALSLLERRPERAAAILEAVRAEEAAEILAEADTAVAAPVIRLMTVSPAARVLGLLPLDTAVAIIRSLPIEFAALTLRLMAKERRQVLLAAQPVARRSRLQLQMRFPEGTAGAVMDPEEFVLPRDISVEAAQARAARSPSEVHYNVYVTDREDRLVGVVTIGELFLADDDRRVEEIMKEATQRLSVHADLATIVAHPGWRQLSALPVVDEKGCFVGAVRYRMLRKIQATQNVVETGDPTVGALGDLYAMGMSGLLNAVVGAMAIPSDRKEGSIE